MKFNLTVDGDFRKMIDKIGRDAAEAITDAVAEAGQALKEDLRSQVTAAGMGQRLANTWRCEVYPDPMRAASLSAAAMVYTRAPQIIESFDKGTVIRGKNGFFLAIPSPAVLHGPNNKKLSPAEVERHYGQRLRLIYRPGRTGLLVFDNVRVDSTGHARIIERVNRDGARFIPLTGRSKKTGTYGRATVVMFTLIPQSRMPKRFDVHGAARAAQNQLPARIARHMARISDQ